MTLAIRQDHRDLQEIAASLLEARGGRAAAAAAFEQEAPSLPGFWNEIVELGWLGVHVPEELGGAGLGCFELAVIAAELGRAVAPGPFLATSAASALIVLEGSEEQRLRWLPELAAGNRLGAVGLDGDLTLAPDLTLTGSAGVVPGGGLADMLALAVGDDMAVIDARAAGVVVEVPERLDAGEPAGCVRLDGVVLEPGQLISGARGRAQAIVRTLAAAHAAGGARACLDMAVGYASTRQQFGRPIGAFQAVKHHCANMLVAAELATASAWDAARAVDGEPEQAELAAAVAAALALPGFLRNAQLNIQVHGGIGFTWEHDAHLYLRRAATLASQVAGARGAADVAMLLERGVERELAVELPPEAEAMREEVRSFAARVRDDAPDRKLAALIDEGYVQPHWPRPWGRAASPVEQLVIEQELRGIERPEYGIGSWILLTLIQNGTEDQLRRWVRPSLECKLLWCQMFSEPGAGSDAAAITTRARRVDGGWRVAGQKAWTTKAHVSDLGLATVRTDPDAPKHAGVTMMVIDLHAEGVDVRPLRDATGGTSFSEVFLDEVFVPDADVVGAVGDGWRVARSTLGNERVAIGADLGALAALDLLDVYRRACKDTDAAASTVGALLAETHALKLLNLRSVQRAVMGGEAGPEGNITKLVKAELYQRRADVALDLAGSDGTMIAGLGAVVAPSVVQSRMSTIGGGTSEIMRNQIAERILGLPRDPLQA